MKNIDLGENVNYDQGSEPSSSEEKRYSEKEIVSLTETFPLFSEDQEHLKDEIESNQNLK